MIHRFRRAIFSFATLAVLAVGGCAQGPAADTQPYPPRSFFVFFASDSVELGPEAQIVIDRIAEEVRQVRATGVGIVGYSSPPGTPAHNLRLSEQRAASVEVALLIRQVPREIITRVSHGETAVIGPPIEGQRVEIVVSKEIRR
jgi:outer membrane protein OmpA-like peptidoglycan-associated protein